MPHHSLRLLLLASLATLLLAAGPPAQARDDHDRARAALQAGEIRPLAELLAEVERRYLGRVIETELDREDGRWIYSFKLLPPTGTVFELDLDAATGRVVDTDGPVQERR